jgi:hypothetical protein
VTRSIDLIKRELEKASQELGIIETEMKSLDTKDQYKCRDALHAIWKATDLISSEVQELLTFDFKP